MVSNSTKLQLFYDKMDKNPILTNCRMLFFLYKCKYLSFKNGSFLWQWENWENPFYRKIQLELAPKLLCAKFKTSFFRISSLVFIFFIFQGKANFENIFCFPTNYIRNEISHQSIRNCVICLHHVSHQGPCFEVLCCYIIVIDYQYSSLSIWILDWTFKYKDLGKTDQIHKITIIFTQNDDFTQDYQLWVKIVVISWICSLVLRKGQITVISFTDWDKSRDWTVN